LSYLIKSKEQLMRQIDNQVDQIQIDLNDAKNDIRLLEDKKNRIDYSQLVKEPISSSGPVSPRKTMIVLVAGFAAAFIGEPSQKTGAGKRDKPGGIGECLMRADMPEFAQHREKDFR